MTRTELWAKINKEDNGKIAYLLLNLAERWHNESNYEDINDYLQVIQKSIPEAIAIHKRPFGITCHCSDGAIRIEAKFKGGYIRLTARNV